VVPEPAGAGLVLAVGQAGGEGDAVLLDVGAGGGVGDGQPQYRHGSDVAADGHFKSGFLVGPARVRAVAVEPGCEQSRWLPVAVNERRPDMPPEYRGPVVAAAGIAAACVPAVLPEPVPQGGAAGSTQRVRADPHHAAAAVAANLTVLEEEVDPALGEVAGPAVPQPLRAAGQPGQQPVELLRSRPARHDLGRGRARTDGRCWREFPGRGNRCAARLPVRGRARGLAGRAGGRDGDGVPGGADGEPEVSWGQGAQIPLAATVLPSEVACAIELRISSLPQTSASPYQDCRAPRSRRPGVATAAGNPPAARPSAAWIWPRQAAQYRSYFDVTLPVCPGNPGTTAHAEGAMACRFNTTSLSVTNAHELDAKYPPFGTFRSASLLPELKTQRWMFWDGVPARRTGRN